MESDDARLEELVLALVATPSVCQRGHSFTSSESRVAYHLFDYRDRLTACFETLESRKHIERDGRFSRPGTGKQIRLLPNGLREYRDAVAPGLGIEEGLCILDEQRRSSPHEGTLISLGFDSELVRILSERIQEATRCEEVELHLASTTMYGSVLEGVLYGLAVRDPRLANTSKKTPLDGSGIPKKFGDWKFVDYANVGVDVGWIPRSVAGHVDQLRDSRNLIHVKKQFDEGFNADRHLVRVTKEVLYAVLDHLVDLV